MASVARTVDNLMVHDPAVRPNLAQALVELDRAVEWVKRRPEGDSESAEQVTAAVYRLRRDLEALGELTIREQMVGEKVDQLGEDLEKACRRLSP